MFKRVSYKKLFNKFNCFFFNICFLLLIVLIFFYVNSLEIESFNFEINFFGNIKVISRELV